LGKALVIAALVIGVALVVAVFVWAVNRGIHGPTVRRRQLQDARDRVRHAEATLDALESEAGTWQDVESVLATQVRQRVQDHRNYVRKQETT